MTTYTVTIHKTYEVEATSPAQAEEFVQSAQGFVLLEDIDIEFLDSDFYTEKTY